MTDQEQALALDLNNLTQEELDWLHDLRNKACALQARLQLKHLKEEAV